VVLSLSTFYEKADLEVLYMWLSMSKSWLVRANIVF